MLLLIAHNSIIAVPLWFKDNCANWFADLIDQIKIIHMWSISVTDLLPIYSLIFLHPYVRLILHRIFLISHPHDVPPWLDFFGIFPPSSCCISAFFCFCCTLTWWFKNNFFRWYYFPLYFLLTLKINYCFYKLCCLLRYYFPHRFKKNVYQYQYVTLQTPKMKQSECTSFDDIKFMLQWS